MCLLAARNYLNALTMMIYKNLIKISSSILLSLIFIVALTFVADAGQGCCSWHGGQSYCDTSSGRWVCNDGTYSPSCMCAVPRPVPQPIAQEACSPYLFCPPNYPYTLLNGGMIYNYQVPYVVEFVFNDVYGHKPNQGESAYWKRRLRTDKSTVSALLNTMRYWKSKKNSPVL